MDIPESKNKMMDSSAVENKEVQPTEDQGSLLFENEYFYPESNGWQSISVRASTKQDADAIYLERRKPVKPEPEKVEAEKESNNE